VTGIGTLGRGIAVALTATTVAVGAPAARAGSCDLGSRGNTCGNAVAAAGSALDQVNRLGGDLPQGAIVDVKKIQDALRRITDDLPTIIQVVGESLDVAGEVLQAVDDAVANGESFAFDQVAKFQQLTGEAAGDYINLVILAANEVKDVALGVVQAENQSNYNANSQTAAGAGDGGLVISRACGATGTVSGPTTMSLTFSGAAVAMYSGSASDPVRATTLVCDVKQGVNTVATVNRTMTQPFSAVFRKITVPYGPFSICGHGTVQLASGAIAAFDDC
jgi:hypothetical protein